MKKYISLITILKTKTCAHTIVVLITMLLSATNPSRAQTTNTIVDSFQILEVIDFYSSEKMDYYNLTLRLTNTLQKSIKVPVQPVMASNNLPEANLLFQLSCRTCSKKDIFFEEHIQSRLLKVDQLLEISSNSSMVYKLRLSNELFKEKDVYQIKFFLRGITEDSRKVIFMSNWTHFVLN